jgi:hypothetical protein
MEPISLRLASGLRLAAHPPRRWAGWPDVLYVHMTNLANQN